MTRGTVTYLADRADELLIAATAAIALPRTTRGVPGVDDTPGRTVATHGKPVFDPEAGATLAVYSDTPAISWTVVARRQSGRGGGQEQVMPIANYVVDLGRRMLTRDEHAALPTDASLRAETDDLQIDGLALVSGIAQAAFAGTLFTIAIPPLVKVQVGDLNIIDTTGGMGGWRVKVKVPIIGTTGVG